MSRRSSSRTTIVTSTTKQARNEAAVDMSLLKGDDFEKRPKTDYTYSRSATYSNKYVDGQVISPNLSRRRLYTSDVVREQQQAASVVRKSSHVKVYGKSRRSDAGSSRLTVVEDTNMTNNNIDVAAAGSNEQALTSTTQQVEYNTLDSNSQEYSSSAGQRVDTNRMSLQQSNNNSVVESVFSDDEEVMSRSTSKRKTTKSAGSRSRSPRRGTRTSGKRRSVRVEDEVDSESSSSLEISKRSGADGKRTASYVLPTGLDSESQSDLVTERSSTIIDTIATGTPLSAKIMGCILFIYGCTKILFSRIWYNFGHPVYTTLQRYLLLDSWLLSRAFIHGLRALLLALLFLLLPLLLLAAGVCGMHAMGFVNVQTCAPLTNVYYVTKQSDVHTAGFSAKLQNLLQSLYSSTEEPQEPPRVVPHQPASPSVDWNSIIDARISTLSSAIALESNKKESIQKQKNTELETALAALDRDVSDMKGRLSSLTSIIADLAELKAQIALLNDRVSAVPDYGDSIAKLQKDIRSLYDRLGEVDIPEDKTSPGVLVYLANEISALKSVVDNRKPVTVTPKDCPDSSCVCESELGLRLSALQKELMRELNEKEGGTQVFVTSDNSSGISEQLVTNLIRRELDIFAADKTGMPDFALQSMGAQVVSTRCSQTYYEQTGIMTYLGIPLYHLHKDPSVVIQPGVTPGECWCFHGQSGSLVIEMADRVHFNAFSLEHISASQAATGQILSAPKTIQVYGLKNEMDTEGQKIGQWRYEASGPRLQFFPVQDSAGVPAYHVVELRVLSNWGQKEFTCLYRFRVHGRLPRKQGGG